MVEGNERLLGYGDCRRGHNLFTMAQLEALQKECWALLE
jgi:hypothetical protein